MQASHLKSLRDRTNAAANVYRVFQITHVHDEKQLSCFKKK